MNSRISQLMDMIKGRNTTVEQSPAIVPRPYDPAPHYKFLARLNQNSQTHEIANVLDMLHDEILAHRSNPRSKIPHVAAAQAAQQHLVTYAYNKHLRAAKDVYHSITEPTVKAVLKPYTESEANAIIDVIRSYK